METISDAGRLPAQVHAAQQAIEALLGDQLVGLYLYGSAVLGGLRPDSDLDLLVITAQSLCESARRSLTEQLLQLSGAIGNRSPKRCLEVTVASRADIEPWRSPPTCDYQYGEWLRQELEAGDVPTAHPDPDLCILLWQARSHSLPLCGPAAGEVIPPIPEGDVRRAIGCSLPVLMADLKGDTRNVLLTLARMWQTLCTGAMTTKDRAAAWAIAQLSPQMAAPLAMALRAYVGTGADRWDDWETTIAPLAALMEQSIRDLLGPAADEH